MATFHAASALPHVLFFRCASLFFSVLCKDEFVKQLVFLININNFVFYKRYTGADRKRETHK